ncbi:hypothetical protein EVAR_28835_1 [Eumeta japonica]|uniref:Uncharacterized protein n=1 Tax=Eumeta variegata TaxID=151549 RepID=A0A4C1WHW8_EUMVA|nr:hypothetical protein EVAR_28835_1 [Eumeta japonica]
MQPATTEAEWAIEGKLLACYIMRLLELMVGWKGRTAKRKSLTSERAPAGPGVRSKAEPATGAYLIVHFDCSGLHLFFRSPAVR